MLYLEFSSPLNTPWLSKSVGELQGRVFGIGGDLIINQKTSGQAKQCMCVWGQGAGDGLAALARTGHQTCVSCLENALLGPHPQISQEFL